MLTACPNCLGERRVAGDVIDVDDAGEEVRAADVCRFCEGRGGFGEPATTQDEVAAE